MEPEELETRLSAAERDASAALVLARAVDRDVADIRGFRRATVAAFNALREEMNERFAQVNERFAQVNERFAQVDRRFEQMDRRFAQLTDDVDRGFIEMRGKFDAAAAGQQQIVGLLETLIEDRGR